MLKLVALFLSLSFVLFLIQPVMATDTSGCRVNKFTLFGKPTQEDYNDIKKFNNCQQDEIDNLKAQIASLIQIITGGPSNTINIIEGNVVNGGGRPTLDWFWKFFTGNKDNQDKYETPYDFYSVEFATKTETGSLEDRIYSIEAWIWLHERKHGREFSDIEIETVAGQMKATFYNKTIYTPSGYICTPPIGPSNNPTPASCIKYE